MLEPTVLPLKSFIDDRGAFNAVLVDAFFGIKEIYTSYNNPKVIRGMHYQEGQGKIVHLVSGEIMDYVLDLRPESPHYLTYKQYYLSQRGVSTLYIPPGVAHGFYTLRESIIIYAMDQFFNEELYKGCNIKSIIPENLYDEAIISQKDRTLPYVDIKGEYV